MTKLKVTELVKKVEFYEGARKILVEILVDVIAGVISKLISGGPTGPQSKATLGNA